MTAADTGRASGSNDASSLSSGGSCGESAGWTIAAPWKLTVAGGIGSTSDRTPPRRTGTVTATRPLPAICLAFQLSGPVAMHSRRRIDLQTTPRDRGSGGSAGGSSPSDQLVAPPPQP